jgi:23S rRNA pseudouridine2605 synthase
VNGKVATIGTSVDPEADVITVGRRTIRPGRIVWIALHKPVGYVVTKRDPRGRKTVFQLLPDVPGLTYVGRLDVATTGLLLFTTDGAAAHRLTHPRYAVERTYRVLVHGRPPHEIRRALEREIVIDGRPVRVVRSRVRPAARGSSDVTLVLAEGRYRIVRRMCDRLKLKVERLMRLSYGPVQLGRLAAGEWRYLTRRELEAVTTE